MKPTWQNESGELYIGDAHCVLEGLPAESVQTCVTSPPYWGLRDYGVAGQIGQEPLHDCLGWATGGLCGKCFVCTMVGVFEEVRRVLRPDGTLWLNLGDSYAGYWGDKKARQEGRPSESDTNGWTDGYSQNSRPQFDILRQSGLKPKDQIGIPWRVAFALQAGGWYLRSDIIWAKPAPMPESVRDRPTRAHETIFLLSKSERYYYDQEAIKEPSRYPEGPHSPGKIQSPEGQGFTRRALAGECVPDKQRGHSRRHDGFNARWDKMTKEEQCSLGRNKRSVWSVGAPRYAGAHYATFPPALIRPCVLAGCPEGGTVLDPFLGSGTTAAVAAAHGRRWIGIDLNPTSVAFTKKRLAQPALDFLAEPVQMPAGRQEAQSALDIGDEGER